MARVSLDKFQGEIFRREILEDFFDILQKFEVFGGVPGEGAAPKSIDLSLVLDLLLGALRGGVYSSFANKHKPVSARNGKCVYEYAVCTRDPSEA